MTVRLIWAFPRSTRGFVAELLVDGLVFGAACASLWTCAAILRQTRLLDGTDGWALAALTAGVLTIIPAQTFGEREHIAARERDW